MPMTTGSMAPLPLAHGSFVGVSGDTYTEFTPANAITTMQPNAARRCGVELAVGVAQEPHLRATEQLAHYLKALPQQWGAVVACPRAVLVILGCADLFLEHVAIASASRWQE